jgi:hypothetical protein
MAGIAASLAALALLVLVFRGRGYARLLSDAHVLELARASRALKEAALARADLPDAPTSHDDPRVWVSSAGAAIVYTIHAHAERCVHHCSVAVVNGPTPHAIGGPLLLIIARVVGLDLERAQLRIGATGMHHLQLALAPDEHARLAAQPAEQVDHARRWLRAALSTRDRLKWQRDDVVAA